MRSYGKEISGVHNIPAKDLPEGWEGLVRLYPGNEPRSAFVKLKAKNLSAEFSGSGRPVDSVVQGVMIAARRYLAIEEPEGRTIYRNWFRVEHPEVGSSFGSHWHAVERQARTPDGPMTSYCGFTKKPSECAQVAKIETELQPLEVEGSKLCPRCIQAMNAKS